MPLTDEDHFALWEGAHTRWYTRRPHLRIFLLLPVQQARVEVKKWFRRRALLDISWGALMVGVAAIGACVVVFTMTFFMGPDHSYIEPTPLISSRLH